MNQEAGRRGMPEPASRASATPRWASLSACSLTANTARDPSRTTPPFPAESSTQEHTRTPINRARALPNGGAFGYLKNAEYRTRGNAS